tara:strand:+ start:7126 stop:7272 length:147 start_codon:yes stop_codon:yes gene_type:complete
VTNIDAPFEKYVLNLTERERVANVHHHGETDDFGRTVEVAKGIFILEG